MLKLLEKLCLANGVSGNEKTVCDLIISKIEGCCSYRVDALGNLIAFKKGRKAPKNKVMLCAHMDEVGLIITSITEDGFLQFETIGGIDCRTIFGTSVQMQNGTIGVIGGKATHHLTGEERDKAPLADALYIDIGATNKEEALQHISLGDTASFCSDFCEFGDGFIKAKALDDRIGCALLIEVMHSELAYDTYFVFHVQEEVGLRGATVASIAVDPAIALVLEATTAADLSGVHGSKQVCRLGGGAVVSFMDGRTIYDKKLYALAFDLAKKQNIQCQTKTAIAGGNDAGAIHRSGDGVRTLAISLPCRYIHSPSCVMKISDIEETRRLLFALLQVLDD